MLRPTKTRQMVKFNTNGYVLVSMPDHPSCQYNGYVYEHRLVMEKMIGRYLSESEVVHHKNGNPSDNRPSNLQLCANDKEHKLLHHPQQFCWCGKKSFGNRLCVSHYHQSYRLKRKRQERCQGCGKPRLHGGYKPKDGRQLCRKCRWPASKCLVCANPVQCRGLCRKHYAQRQERKRRIPCARCGVKIRKEGRNRLPVICWKCAFPKRKCRICGGKHEARGLCENHYKQWRRGKHVSSGFP